MVGAWLHGNWKYESILHQDPINNLWDTQPDVVLVRRGD